ncbi:MAG: aldo/keto reductase [Candidatus Binataceae bacterium]
MEVKHPSSPAFAPAFQIGGDLTVRRLGFGAMRLTGKGIWGEPKDRIEAKRVLKRALDLGVNLMDTADSYGPDVSEELIGEALYPYPHDLVIATKAGLTRPGPSQWVPKGDPKHLKASCDGSLKRLRRERIDLYQLHRPDPNVPLEDSVGALADLRIGGKIRHVGLSNVNSDELRRAQAIVPIVSIQNRYNMFYRTADALVDRCAAEGIAFLPWAPLDSGAAAKNRHLKHVAAAHGATPIQVAIAWLLNRSPVIIPIPGTSSIFHLEENMGAARLCLTQAELGKLGL